LSPCKAAIHGHTLRVSFSPIVHTIQSCRSW